MASLSRASRRRAPAAFVAYADDDDGDDENVAHDVYGYDDDDGVNASASAGYIRDIAERDDGANGPVAASTGLAALLPAAMRGRPATEDRTEGRGPLELQSAAELDNLMSTDDNAVVYFYKPECPYCKMFAPDYEALAADVHRTNLASPVAAAAGIAPVPIVMAQIDGARHREAINALRDGFLGARYGRGYPTVLFKRGADKVGVTWDSTQPRTRENIARLMSRFYNDPTLAPMDATALADTMRNPDPEFIYFGSDNVTLVPRFVRPLDPSYVNIEDALATMALLMSVDAPLAARGAFYPVNQADRKDIPIPAIVQVTQDGERLDPPVTYSNRDAHRWAAAALADQLGLAPPVPGNALQQQQQEQLAQQQQQEQLAQQQQQSRTRSRGRGARMAGSPASAGPAFGSGFFGLAR
ncbi:Disulfide isomerase [Pandoravirus macleodensis]|uniref:Disulfide isomerase n=1 Tax=Pandoravirus macleodensis TaxID=2107707 RepID=A0A2U7UF34_9VIRU|nr:Disulfide isomerase [Pandoravirus macleodensis]AVK77012.1 Disulfide isomerase [Pandoravirus macleodensis]